MCQPLPTPQPPLFSAFWVNNCSHFSCISIHSGKGRGRMDCFFVQPPFWVLRDKADAACLGLAKLSLWLKPLRVPKRQLCGRPSTPSAVFFCLILGHTPGQWGWGIRVAGLRCPFSDVAWWDWASHGGAEGGDSEGGERRLVFVWAC